MDWKKVVGIIRTEKLGAVEERLKEIRVRGISVTRGKGYGEYANFFASNWSVTHARLEIYCKSSKADEIVDAIMDAAQTGLAGDGIIAVIPVEKLYRIRTKTQANGDNV